MSGRKKLIWIASVAIGVAGLISGYRYCLSSIVDSDTAFVTWFPGPPARDITVSVRDSNGVPRVNVEVHVDNVSGGSTKVTDANGIAVFSAADFGGEDRLTGLSIDGEAMLRRGALLGVGAPSVVEGLHLHVILKSPQH
jgi:hypothetical protein